MNTEREEEEGRRQEELIRQQLLAEQRRLEAERQERERLRQEAELRQVQARHLKEKVAQFSQTAIGQKVIQLACEYLLRDNVLSFHYIFFCRLLKKWKMKIYQN